MSLERHGVRGGDDLSEFWLRRGCCSVCGARGVVLRYRRKRVPDDAAVGAWRAARAYHGLTWRDLLENPSSILRHSYGARTARQAVRDGRTDGALGVTCGCYARFHRQLAHIGDSMAARRA